MAGSFCRFVIILRNQENDEHGNSDDDLHLDNQDDNDHNNYDDNQEGNVHFWSRQFACATHCGVRKRSWTLLTYTFDPGSLFVAQLAVAGLWLSLFFLHSFISTTLGRSKNGMEGMSPYFNHHSVTAAWTNLEADFLYATLDGICKE